MREGSDRIGLFGSRNMVVGKGKWFEEVWV
jgi:hypothetical protein